MKKIVIVGLIFLLILISGCTTTSCIPVTPTAKYPTAGSIWGTFVIGGEIIQAYPTVYQTLEVNKTSRVRFEIMNNGNTVINSVCSP